MIIMERFSIPEAHFVQKGIYEISLVAVQGGQLHIQIQVLFKNLLKYLNGTHRFVYR
jgi:hypothetical protein